MANRGTIACQPGCQIAWTDLVATITPNLRRTAVGVSLLMQAAITAGIAGVGIWFLTLGPAARTTGLAMLAAGGALSFVSCLLALRVLTCWQRITIDRLSITVVRGWLLRPSVRTRLDPADFTLHRFYALRQHTDAIRRTLEVLGRAWAGEAAMEVAQQISPHQPNAAVFFLSLKHRTDRTKDILLASSTNPGVIDEVATTLAARFSISLNSPA